MNNRTWYIFRLFPFFLTASAICPEGGLSWPALQDIYKWLCKAFRGSIAAIGIGEKTMNRGIMHISFVAVAVLLIACTLSPENGVANQKKARAKNVVPDITQILGVKVGSNTIETLEKKFCPGAPCMGGHPHGGRAWYLVSQRIWIYADGFEYVHAGRIIDSIQVGLRKKDMEYGFKYEEPYPVIPKVNISSKAIGWIGHILPGLTKQEVLKFAHNLPKPIATGDALIWSMEGTCRTMAGTEPAIWTAELTFKKNILTTIEISI